MMVFINSCFIHHFHHVEISVTCGFMYCLAREFHIHSHSVFNGVLHMFFSADDLASDLALRGFHGIQSIHGDR